jgi:hypothetical protein
MSCGGSPERANLVAKDRTSLPVPGDDAEFRGRIRAGDRGGVSGCALGEEHGRAGAERDACQGAQAPQHPRPHRHGVEQVPAAGLRRERGQEEDRHRPSEAKPGTEGEAEPDLSENERNDRESPEREREDEGDEAEPEEHAVRSRGGRERQPAPPALGNLASDLRDDADAAGFGCGRCERDGYGHCDGRADCNRTSQRAQAYEGGDPAREGSKGERDARGGAEHGGAGLPDSLDHREPARRPRSGESRDESGRAEDGG